MAKTGCDKDCSTCDMGNRTFCAVQLGLKNQELIVRQGAIISRQQEMIGSLVQLLSPLLAQDAAPIPPIPGGGEPEKVPENKTKN